MRKLVIGAFVLILVLVLLNFYMSYRNRNHDPNTAILYGNVDVRQVDISFRVAGLVNHMPFEEGDVVKKGDLLATIERNPYEDQMHQSSSNLEAVRVQFENTEKLLKRRQELIGSGGISQEDLETAESNYNQYLANLLVAEAAFAVAQDNLSFTKAFCPSDGVILTRIREPGSVVNAAEPVYTVSISHPIWVRAFVDEELLGLVYPGMKAEVFTDTPGGKSYQGRVGFISPVAEFTPKTVETTQLRTDLVYRLRIYVENADKGLRQGQPVTVKLRLNDEEQDRSPK